MFTSVLRANMFEDLHILDTNSWVIDRFFLWDVAFFYCLVVKYALWSQWLLKYFEDSGRGFLGYTAPEIADNAFLFFFLFFFFCSSQKFRLDGDLKPFRLWIWFCIWCTVETFSKPPDLAIVGWGFVSCCC